MLTSTSDSLTFTQDHHTLTIQSWGPHALRIRATSTPLSSDSTGCPIFPSQPSALTEPIPSSNPTIHCPPLSEQPPLPAPGTYTTEPPSFCKPATLAHGNVKATITALGQLTLHNVATNNPILIEKTRTRIDPYSPTTSALEIPAREFQPRTASDHYHLTYRLESLDAHEKIFGGGQYQQPNLDLKGCDLELAQRNSQASVPFFVSSLGYGILWNNPSIGRAVFGRNGTTFEAHATQVLDIWIVCPPPTTTDQQDGKAKQENVWKQIMHLYADVTGHAPSFPSWALGFWQSKLRYRTQDETLAIARGFRDRGLALSVLVVDFFHWPTQGDWKFDTNFFPDPKAMIAELTAMGIKLLVSIWPTVDTRSENHATMLEGGMLIRVDRGLRVAMDFMGNTVHADFTNPKARGFVWEVVKKNYWDLGVRTFWLDEAEPEYSRYDFANYRYAEGTDLSIGNVYPVRYAQAFWDGQVSTGQQSGDIVNLIRCAWAGSQKFGTLVWSGDIASSWGSFRNQLAAGLQMGLSGIPWWTTDIGGFHGGRTDDPGFQELLVRWFQWGCFCPVMRLHGSREPMQAKLGEGGGSDCRSGADNEPWSYGEDNYSILKRYLKLRERLKPYVAELMTEASKSGTPLMRMMWFEFPGDEICWGEGMEGQYMFGGKYLVAPVMEAGMNKRRVYLPRVEGMKWAQLRIKEDSDEMEAEQHGGEWVDIDVSIKDMPVFVRIEG
ncbi:hypothetical protein H2198_001052 [Neophaeococcomyces mojaviensis]|uniref:Uncharacterized protein n=1 Tax=Neophaeococcomyces mojaviensis TaxID=3383035 RepID=A0ACC3AIP4_9EURO|nr:hypothetical protein H2198_001052 [Knufia sp. JES_112]